MLACTRRWAALNERALDLQRCLGDRNIFVTLTGAWVFHVVRGDLEQARHFSLTPWALWNVTQLLTAAGNFILGSCLFHLGQLEASLHHMNAAFSGHSGRSESVLELFAGPDVGVFCQSYLAHLAWHREGGGQPGTHATEAIAAARRLRHPFSQAIALDYAYLPKRPFRHG